MSWTHSAAYPLRRQARHGVADRRRLLPGRATGTATVVICGELDLTITSSLAEHLAQVLGSKPRQLIFDMAGVGFLDCASARVIAATAGFLPDGRRPVVRGPSPAVRRTLELTGLDACCQVELPDPREPGQRDARQLRRRRSADEGQLTFFHR